LLPLSGNTHVVYSWDMLSLVIKKQKLEMCNQCRHEITWLHIIQEALHYSVLDCKKEWHKYKQKQVPSCSSARLRRAWDGHSSKADMSLAVTGVSDCSWVPVKDLAVLKIWHFNPYQDCICIIANATMLEIG
jgi:hypothetical protein